jgi:hypothetical protein
VGSNIGGDLHVSLLLITGPSIVTTHRPDERFTDRVAACGGDSTGGPRSELLVLAPRQRSSLRLPRPGRGSSPPAMLNAAASNAIRITVLKRLVASPWRCGRRDAPRRRRRSAPCLRRPAPSGPMATRTIVGSPKYRLPVCLGRTSCWPTSEAADSSSWRSAAGERALGESQRSRPHRTTLPTTPTSSRARRALILMAGVSVVDCLRCGVWTESSERTRDVNRCAGRDV